MVLEAVSGVEFDACKVLQRPTTYIQEYMLKIRAR